MNMLGFILSIGLVLAGLAMVYFLAQQADRRSALEQYLSDEKFKLTAAQRIVKTIETYLPTVLSSDTEEIQRAFESAGFYNFKYAQFFMPAKYGTAIIGALFIYLFAPEQWEQMSVVTCILVLLVVCIALPDSYLGMRAKGIREHISIQLPYMIDLLSMCVQTGMTVEAALEYVATEIGSFDPDMAIALKKTNDRARVVGLPLALDDLYERVPTNEVRSFVMTLKQSLQYGSSIFDVLTRLSSDIREVNMLALEAKVGSLSAKMSAPLILFIMIPVVILIVAPGIMRMLG